MGDNVWRLPREQFVETWNRAGSLDEAAAAIRAAVGPPAPRWALIARAAALRKEGVELKPLATGA